MTNFSGSFFPYCSSRIPPLAFTICAHVSIIFPRGATSDENGPVREMVAPTRIAGGTFAWASETEAALAKDRLTRMRDIANRVDGRAHPHSRPDPTCGLVKILTGDTISSAVDLSPAGHVWHTGPSVEHRKWLAVFARRYGPVGRGSEIPWASLMPQSPRRCQGSRASCVGSASCGRSQEQVR